MLKFFAILRFGGTLFVCSQCFQAAFSNFKFSQRVKTLHFLWRPEIALSLDIKNSQPYLSTVLLNYLEWLAYINNELEDNNLLKVIVKDKKDRLFSTNNTINSYVMLAQSAAMQSNSDLQRFTTLVQQGNFMNIQKSRLAKNQVLNTKTEKK